jgi:hypothetical protein
MIDDAWNHESEECAACLKYSVLIFVKKKYIKCNIWRVVVRSSGMLVLYIGHMILKG